MPSRAVNEIAFRANFNEEGGGNPQQPKKQPHAHDDHKGK